MQRKKKAIAPFLIMYHYRYNSSPSFIECRHSYILFLVNEIGNTFPEVFCTLTDEQLNMHILISIPWSGGGSLREKQKL